MTYDDWQAAGFQVKAGQRSRMRDRKGRPVFFRDQVEAKRGFDNPGDVDEREAQREREDEP